jgi:DNA-3-methyladenine glycosylase I
MQHYHDTVWGVPQFDPTRLFEFLTLEGAQAGLSWRTILLKRDGYQNAFAQFDIAAVAAFDERDVERLMQDTSIVRNRLKITSTIDNARAWLQLPDPVQLMWSFVDGAPLQSGRMSMSDVPASTPASDRMSKDLKRRGFRFVGTTICYAYMQACGMVNDHVATCFRHDECAALG